jgi:hypothetical protein
MVQVLEEVLYPQLDHHVFSVAAALARAGGRDRMICLQTLTLIKLAGEK